MSERKIIISAGSVRMEAGLNESRTAGVVWDALPIERSGSLWGEEIYFSIPVECGPEEPQSVVDPGAIAYWPPGSAFCIFFGPTPASRGTECRPASPVNVLGRILGDPKDFLSVPDGAAVRLERAP